MKSKISRLEAQEQALLEQMLKSKKDLEEKDRNGFIRKKEKMPKKEVGSSGDSLVSEEPQINDEVVKKKKRKSKASDPVEIESNEEPPKKHRIKSKSNTEETEVKNSNNEEPLRKKKKKSKVPDSELIEEDIGTASKSKKKSKKNKS